MRLVPPLVRRHTRFVCATFAAASLAAAGLFAQLGAYDPSFDGELWTVKQDVAVPGAEQLTGVAYLDSKVYVTDSINNTVAVYDASGQRVAMPSGAWTGVPGLNFWTLGTATVKVDGVTRGAVLVSDQLPPQLIPPSEPHNRVVAFDATGHHLFTLRVERPTNDALYSLSVNQTALAPGSRFELTTGPSPSLRLIGTFVAGWTEQWNLGGVHSGALAYRDVVFAEANGEFQATGAAVLDGQSLDSVMPAPINMYGVTFDQNGNLFLIDSQTERLHVYGPDLVQRFSFGTATPDLKTAEFNEPWGLAFWPDASGISGRLFIADTNKATIEAYRTVDADADGSIDDLQFLYPIDNLIHHGPELWPLQLAIDPVNNRIAMTAWDGYLQVLGFPRLAAFDVRLLDSNEAPIDGVCAGEVYKVRFSLTVPAGSPAAADVMPTLTVDGVAGASPAGPGTLGSLAAGQVATYTYTLNAPATAHDILIVAGATASSTTDILPRQVLATVANCGADTATTVFSVTPSHPAQVSGWTPIYSTADQYSVTVAAHDPDLVDTIEYKLSGANETGYEVVRTSFASGADNSVAIPLPNLGRTAIQFRARDGNHVWSAWQTLNVRPKLVVNRVTNENSPEEFRVGDPEGIGFTYSVNRLPAGVTFSTSTGQFAGIPSFDAHDPYSADPEVASGVYHIVVTERDPAGSTSDVEFTWTIPHINRHPSITSVIHGFSVDLGQPFSLQINGFDPDHDPVLWTMNGRGIHTGQDIPSYHVDPTTGAVSGIKIDPATGLISGTFPPGSDTDYTLSVGLAECVTLVEGSPCVGLLLPGEHLATLYEITVGVLNLNQRADVVNPGGQVGAENDDVSLQITASDPEQDTLTYVAGGLPPGLSIDGSTGRITGKLPYTSAGTYAVTVEVYDGVNGQPRAISFSWLVTNTNRPPTLSLPNRTNNEGEVVSGSLAGFADDPDGDAVQFVSISGQPGSVAMTSAGLFSGTFDFNAAGTYTVTVAVSDGSATARATFTWTINEVNRLPGLIVANQISAEGATVSLPIQGSDPDGDPLTFSMNGLPAGFTINPATGVITGTFDFNSAGVYQVNVGLVDRAVGILNTFKWTVTETNRPPNVAPIPDRTNSEGEAIDLVLTTAADPDGNSVMLSVAGLPPGLSMNADARVTGTLPYTAAGDYSVTITAGDGNTVNGTTSVTFTWHVLNVNRRPDVINPGPQTSAEGAVVTLQVLASDPDGDTLTYTATNLPPGLSINAATGVISGTVSYTASGSYTVTVTAKDPGGLSDTETFTWTVTDVNRPPIARDDSSSVTAGQSVVVNVRHNDEDPDGNALTTTSVTQPAAGQGTVTINADGTVSYTAPASFVGTTTFTYTIQSKGGDATATVTVAVLSANKAPVCSAAFGGEIWPPNHKRFYVAPVLGVTDPDGDTFTVKIDAILQDEIVDGTGDGAFSPDGYVEGGIAWVRAERNGHDNNSPGNGRVYEILFTATDRKGGSCQGSVLWTVPHDQGQRSSAIDDIVRYDSTARVPGTVDKTLIHQKSPRP